VALEAKKKGQDDNRTVNRNLVIVTVLFWSSEFKLQPGYFWKCGFLVSRIACNWITWLTRAHHSSYLQYSDCVIKNPGTGAELGWQCTPVRGWGRRTGREFEEFEARLGYTARLCLSLTLKSSYNPEERTCTMLCVSNTIHSIKSKTWTCWYPCSRSESSRFSAFWMLNFCVTIIVYNFLLGAWWVKVGIETSH
jgi:hypothetical protein